MKGKKKTSNQKCNSARRFKYVEMNERADRERYGKLDSGCLCRDECAPAALWDSWRVFCVSSPASNLM